MNIKIAAVAVIISCCGLNGIDLLMAQQADDESMKIENGCKKYFDSSNDYRLKADQARVDGKNDLADILIKCADARHKMGDACKSDNKEMFSAGRTEFLDAKQELTAQEEAEKAGVKDKASKMRDAAVKYEKAAKDFEHKAEELGEDDQMSGIYNKLAAAYHRVAEGYKNSNQEMVNSGFEDYKNAQKEKDRLNRTKEKKKLKKAVVTEDKPADTTVANVPASTTTAPIAPTGKPTNKLPDYKLD